MASYPESPDVGRNVRRQDRALNREIRRSRRGQSGSPVFQLPYLQFVGEVTLMDPGGVDDVTDTQLIKWLDTEDNPIVDNEWELADYSESVFGDVAEIVSGALGGPDTALIPPYGAPARYTGHVNIQGDVGDWTITGGNGIVIYVPMMLGGLIRDNVRFILGNSGEIASVVLADGYPFAFAASMRSYGNLGGDPVEPRPEAEFYFTVNAMLTVLDPLDRYNTPIGGF